MRDPSGRSGWWPTVVGQTGGAGLLQQAHIGHDAQGEEVEGLRQRCGGGMAASVTYCKV